MKMESIARILCLLGLFSYVICLPVTYDTIVIGLGASGTAAATTLAKAGKKVLALEAQDRIGGRVRTVPFGDGVVEVGGEWIHGTEDSRVYDLAVQNNITVLPQGGDYEVFYSDGTEANFTLIDDLLGYTLGIKDEQPEKPEPLGQFLTKKLREYTKSHHPHIDVDSDMFKEILLYMDVFIDSYEATDNWNDVTTASTSKDLGGNQDMSWHRHGYKTVFEILMNTYNNGPGLQNLDVKLNTEVTNIAWDPSSSRDVTVTCKDGAVYKASNVIFTASIGVLKANHKTLFTPELPADKVEAINNIGFGVIDKVIYSFENMDWVNDTAYLFIWKTADREKLSEDKKWYTLSDGISIPMGCGNCLTMWFNGDAARKIETHPEEVDNVFDVIKMFMGKKYNIPEPVSVLHSNWYTNPFTRGSYSYDSLSTPEHPNARNNLAKPLVDASNKPRVLFAGEATNTLHYSTVHGALETGYREATRLLN